jgi:hypothetical protein
MEATMEATPPDREGSTMQMPRLEALQHEENPDILENAVISGVDFINRLGTLLDGLGNTAAHWRATIAKLIDRPTPRTVVGIVGNTGAGKSSIINAVLDEERYVLDFSSLSSSVTNPPCRLLPTNCLRACTAAPTEVAWNFSEDPDEIYRAEIEFISHEGWSAELKTLVGDLQDGSSSGKLSGDSEEAIAYAKIRAVYPNLDKTQIPDEGEELADYEYVRKVLGTKIKIRSRTAADLSAKLRKYVDSKEKKRGRPAKNRQLEGGDGSGRDANEGDEPDFEYWPLIKVVRIFTKAEVLELGTVLVDLVGYTWPFTEIFANMRRAWCRRFQRGPKCCRTKLHEGV